MGKYIFTIILGILILAIAVIGKLLYCGLKNIKIDEFEGPLDLLLHLIKKSNINIHDISIDEITKKYLEYIKRQNENYVVYYISV